MHKNSLKYNSYFVTGIGTNVGKTIVSTILTEASSFDYWKPIQCGILPQTDSAFVKSLISNTTTKILPEHIVLNAPQSPHYAAQLENKMILLKDVEIPHTAQNNLIIEGAGGLLVPLNQNQEYVIDIAKKNNSKIVLVINSYLGCINHTLLSLNYIKQHNLQLHTVVFNGEVVKELEKVILNEIAQPINILKVAQLKIINQKTIKEVASNIQWL